MDDVSTTTEEENFRSGFVTFVGRPNTGKSTLTNALVGQKVAITSARPQTTRHAARGIVQGKSYQLVVVDTPGIHKPRTLLGQRLNDLVDETIHGVEVIGFCLPASEKLGPGDRFVLQRLESLGSRHIVAVVTKIDQVTKAALAAALVSVESFGRKILGEDGFAHIVPVSSVRQENVQRLADIFSRYCPLSPPLYPQDAVKDTPEHDFFAELIREAALDKAREELPHSLTVTIEEVLIQEQHQKKSPLTTIYAKIYVERDSQRVIVLGKKGERLRQIGTTARHSLEEYLGTRVYLNLHVAVAKDWQQDPKQLMRLGF